ncbi:hypothetical protein VSQ78_23065 [Nocardiopsis alba]|uniref:Uncharacterized protein n=1 Tax=Nocardiopsis alba TaxID=53437 RepID=A0ABV5E164_9ACTN|nr:hypothetical protein [Nocardiopsis alba]
MSQESLEVDVESAHSGGMESAYAAARLKDLPDDFGDAAESAKSAADHDPGVSGWANFRDKYEYQMRNVSYHAENLAENIQAGSVDVAVTHLEAADEFEGVNGAPQLR